MFQGPDIVRVSNLVGCRQCNLCRPCGIRQLLVLWSKVDKHHYQERWASHAIRPRSPCSFRWNTGNLHCKSALRGIKVRKVRAKHDVNFIKISSNHHSTIISQNKHLHFFFFLFLCHLKSIQFFFAQFTNPISWSNKNVCSKAFGTFENYFKYQIIMDIFGQRVTLMCDCMKYLPIWYF